MTPYEFISKKGVYLPDFAYLKNVDYYPDRVFRPSPWNLAFYNSRDLHDFLVLNDIIGALTEHQCQVLMCEIIILVRHKRLNRGQMEESRLAMIEPMLSGFLKGTATWDEVRARAMEISLLMVQENEVDHEVKCHTYKLLRAFTMPEAERCYASAGPHGHAVRTVGWEAAWLVAKLKPREGKSCKELQMEELEFHLEYHDSIGRAVENAENLTP